MEPEYVPDHHRPDAPGIAMNFDNTVSIYHIVAEGDTFEQAVANGAEALAGHFAAMRADGDLIPPPRSFDDLRGDPSFVEDSSDAIVTMIAPGRAMATAK